LPFGHLRFRQINEAEVVAPIGRENAFSQGSVSTEKSRFRFLQIGP
jgi:hypothetical protein